MNKAVKVLRYFYHKPFKLCPYFNSTSSLHSLIDIAHTHLYYVQFFLYLHKMKARKRY